jgi:hypothetical protein
MVNTAELFIRKLALSSLHAWSNVGIQTCRYDRGTMQVVHPKVGRFLFRGSSPPLLHDATSHIRIISDAFSFNFSQYDQGKILFGLSIYFHSSKKLMYKITGDLLNCRVISVCFVFRNDSDTYICMITYFYK